MKCFILFGVSALVTSGLAQRGQTRTSSRTRSRPGPRSQNRQFEVDYYDYDALPQGPTRNGGRLGAEYEDYYYDYYDDPLPAGPTREPPLPVGPTRRPGQPTRLPPAPQVGVPGDVYRNLPLLTTRSPPTATPRPNVNFRIPPPQSRGNEPVFELPSRPGHSPAPHRGPQRRRPSSQGLLVTSDLDILDQTKLFASMDPHQEQFIKAPRLNAGALPLAFEAPDSSKKTFFPPLPPLLDGP